MPLSSNKKINAYAEHIVSSIRHPFLILDSELRVISANGPFFETFQTIKEEIYNKKIYEISNGEWDIPKLRLLFDSEIKRSALINNYKLEHKFSKVGKKNLILNCSLIPNDEGAPGTYMLSIEDATYDAVSANNSVCDMRMNDLLDALPKPIYTTDEKGRITMYNKEAVKFAGREPKIGVDKWLLVSKIFDMDGKEIPREESPIAKTVKLGHPIQNIEIYAEKYDGSNVIFTSFPSLLYDMDGKISGAVNMIVDITDRKKAENASLQLAAIVESSTDAIISLNADGIITSWNQGAEVLSGYKASEMVGMREIDFIPDRHKDFERNIFLKVLKEKSTHHYETTRKKKNGTVYDLFVTASPIKNKTGKIIGVSAIAHDITNRKIAEKALRKSEERYVLAEKATNDGLWDWNTKTGDAYLSPRWKSLLGYEEHELPNHIDSFFNNIYPDDVEVVNVALKDHFNSDRPFNVEVRLMHKDGKIRWFRVRGQAIKDEDGEVFRMVGSTRNINYRKQKEELLVQSERRYRRIFEAAKDGILMLDSEDLKISDANPYILDLMGYSKDEIIDKELHGVGIMQSAEKSKELFDTLMNHKVARYDDLDLLTKNGDRCNVELIGNMYEENNTDVIQLNIRDITERKRLEAVKETELLLKSEKVRTQFIADATHELRTPLAIIKGNVDLGLRAQKPNQSVLKAIEVEVKHLAELLSDLTILTTKESSDLQIMSSKASIKKLLENAVNRCIPIAMEKKIQIKMHDIADIEIPGDSLYLEKLFINIINNAIIYGNEGGEVVLTTATNGNTVEIRIKDNGIGIPPDELPYIFERFYRTNKARTSKNSGTGLGLAISKWVVESHKGSIDAVSDGENGSEFIITLPLQY